MNVAGVPEYQYEGTLVYASVNNPPEDGGSLRNWLDNYLDRQPGVNVKIRHRQARPYVLHCRHCKQMIQHCPHCDQTKKNQPKRA